MEWLQLLGAGGLFALIASVLTFIATRKKDTSSDSQARFEANLELGKYVDTKVSLALAPALVKIEKLELAMGVVIAREQATKNILRRFFQRLVFWNEQGRPGEMPLPTREDMETLDISDLVPLPALPPIEGATQ